MSSVVARLVFTVAIGAIGALAAYFLTQQAQTNEPYQGQRRRRRPSTPPPSLNRSWYEDDPKDEAELKVVEDNDNDGTTAKKRKNNNKCVICLEKFEDLKRRGHELHTTLCGHIFCARCIRTALRQNPACPQCRHRCEPGSTHVVYI